MSSNTEDVKNMNTPTSEPAAEAAAESTPVQSPGDAARARASQFMAEGRYVDARKALEEAERLEAEPLKVKAQKFAGSIKSRIASFGAGNSETTESGATEASALSPVEQSISTVDSYSKIAAAVGLLPGGPLNFAAILAVQVTMVWKISKNFGHEDGKDRIRGSVMSLFGSFVSTTVGHGAGVAIASIPAVIAGTLVYFLVTPVLAYAMTKAVGNTYIMHFESGGTLLTFDPKAFADYFLAEFKKAGGKVAAEAEPVSAQEAEPVPAV